MSMRSPTPPTNRPVWSFAALLVFVTSLVILYVTGSDSGAAIFIALVVANLPTLVAAVASEQAARDIRNGTLARKAKEGAREAIDEAGVVTQDGPVVAHALATSQQQLATSAAAVDALRVTLEQVHQLSKKTAEKVEKLDGETA